MNTLALFCVTLIILPLCLGITNLTEKYPFSITLTEGSYYLYWNFTKADENIQFAVRVYTTGWIGFGISPNGQMPGSDVVIGWIDQETSYFHDRFAFQRALPPIDPKQNWYLTNSEEEDGYTQLEFNRDYITCDDRDREILAETSRIVFSWNDKKPTVTNNSDGSITYSIDRHQQQGSTSINLLGGLPTPPEIPTNASSFVVGVEEVTIPATDTTYYCRGVKLNEAIRSQEKYIIKFSPDISAGSEQYVHHMLIYICDGLQEEDLGKGGDCDTEVSERIGQCLGSLLIAAWAVGGSEFIYPDSIAYPLGGPNDKQFAVIQMHYNNPELVSDVVDNSGLKFTYIDTRREHDAGIIFLGHEVYRTMVIPPSAPNYTITTFCTEKCTEKYFPSDGIHIFANMLHTHTIGTGLEFSVVDETNCSSGQSRVEQTQIVERNVKYDFNFQQANHLSEEIIVKPGSILLLNCFYNSTRRSEATLGGESTKEEMCLSFPVYYPRIQMTQCTSGPTLERFGNFIQDYVPREYQEQFEELTRDSSPEEITATFGLLEWNETQLQGLYDNVYKNAKQHATCYDGIDDFDLFMQYQPTLCCVYETENQCTGTIPKPCCQRTCVNTQGGAAILSTSVVILFLGLFLSTLMVAGQV